MDKKRILLVLSTILLFLLIIPSVFAQTTKIDAAKITKDIVNSLELAFSWMPVAFSKDYILFGFLLIFLWMIVYGAFYMGLKKHFEKGGASPSKEVKTIAFALSGIGVLSLFFGIGGPTAVIEKMRSISVAMLTVMGAVIAVVVYNLVKNMLQDPLEPDKNKTGNLVGLIAALLAVLVFTSFAGAEHWWTHFVITAAIFIALFAGIAAIIKGVQGSLENRRSRRGYYDTGDEERGWRTTEKFKKRAGKWWKRLRPTGEQTEEEMKIDTEMKNLEKDMKLTLHNFERFMRIEEKKRDFIEHIGDYWDRYKGLWRTADKFIRTKLVELIDKEAEFLEEIHSDLETLQKDDDHILNFLKTAWGGPIIKDDSERRAELQRLKKIIEDNNNVKTLVKQLKALIEDIGELVGVESTAIDDRNRNTWRIVNERDQIFKPEKKIGELSKQAFEILEKLIQILQKEEAEIREGAKIGRTRESIENV